MIRSIIALALSYFLILGQTIAVAQSTAAILPQGKTQFLDNNGNPLSSGKVFFYIPSTLTSKTTWQDSSKTIANTNPVTLDAGGRAIIYGDGTYRQIVRDRNNNQIYDAVTASAGTGGGTTGTGDGDLVGTVKPWAGLVAPNQYAFAYGQEISRTTYSVLFTAITLQQTINCTSGSPIATGFSDTSQIPNNAVIESTCFAAGTTVVSKTSTTVTFNNNSSLSTSDTIRIFMYGNGNGSTTFNLPDLRGFFIAGRNNMGGTAGPNLTGVLGTNPNAIGAAFGGQQQTLTTPNLPAYTPAGTVVAAGTISQITPAGSISQITPAGSNSTSVVTGTTASVAIFPTGGGGGGNRYYTPDATGVSGTIATSGTAAAQTFTGTPVTPTFTGTPVTPTFTNGASTFSGTAQGGTATAFNIIPPTLTLNYIIKITPDTNSADASGVTSLGGMTGDISCGAGLLCTSNTISSVLGIGTSGYALIGNGASASTYQGFTQAGTGASTRTWQDKGRDIVTIKDFGATSDATCANVVANTAAVQAALTSAATNVVVPDGTFCTDLITPVSNQTISGSGTLKAAGGITSNFILINSKSNVTIRDIKIDVNSVTFSGANAIGVATSNNVLVENVDFINSGRFGILYNGCVSCSFLNNTVTNFAQSAITDFGGTISNLKIIGNRITTPATGISNSIIALANTQTDTIISKNYVDGNSGAAPIFGIYFGAGAMTRGLISENIVRNTAREGIAGGGFYIDVLDNQLSWDAGISLDFGISAAPAIPAPTSHKMRWARNRIFQAGIAGIAIGTTCTENIIEENFIINVNQLNDGTNGNGIELSGAGCFSNIIRNNVIANYSGGGGHAKYCIKEFTGTDLNKYDGNYCYSMETDDILLSGSNSKIITQYETTAGVPNGSIIFNSIKLRGSTSGTLQQSAPAIAGTTVITWGNSNGTPAVTASAPLTINTTTGNITTSAATNTVLANATSGTAAVTALSVPSCSTASSALIWTTNTGFGCNTSITAASIPVGGITGLGTGVATFLATPSSANLASAVTGETGTGALVFANGPIFAAPHANGYILDGAVSGTLTLIPPSIAGASAITFPAGTTDFSSTGGTSQFVKQNSAGAPFTVSQVGISDLSGLGTGVATALAINIGSAGSMVIVGGGLGSPASVGIMPAFTLGGTITGGAQIVDNLGITGIGGNAITGRTLSLRSGSQPTFGFYSANGAVGNKMTGLLHDGGVALGAPGIVIQNLDDAGAFVSNSGVIWRDSSITIGSINKAAAGSIKVLGYAVASLPTCNATSVGSKVYVSDATVTTFASTVAGGGANIVPVFCNGTNWIIG